MPKIKKYFPVSVQGWLVLLATMGISSLTCFLLGAVTTSDTHVPLIFVLAVLITALMTEGYLYGFIASILSVFAVNWAFTFPYMKLDFTIYGYPLTFLTMLAVGFAVSTLTSRLKTHEKIKAEAEQEKTRANLLRAVSHDLRTPLTSISGSLGVILDGNKNLDENDSWELLQDAKKDAEWLCRMVENLLSITRMSEGQENAIHMQPELLEEVISGAVMNFNKRNPQITVRVSVPEEPVFALMDAMLIEQLLFNLLDNSVLHGGCTDTIRISVERQGSMSCVRLSDNGNGIDPVLLPVLFEGSSRLATLRDRDDNRFMGIGLSVCRTIVNTHGGSISARNLPEGGAEFTFTLPVEESYEHT